MTRKALAGGFPFPCSRNSPGEGQGPCSCGSGCFNGEARVTRNTPGPTARLLKDTQELDWGERAWAEPGSFVPGRGEDASRAQRLWGACRGRLCARPCLCPAAAAGRESSVSRVGGWETCTGRGRKPECTNGQRRGLQ